MSENTARILLAEDDSNLSTLLEEYLQLKGYKITLCRDGAEALSAYHRGEFDMCLFDVMMPKMDGFTLAGEIRKLDNEIPIIFLTAKSMKDDKMEGFSIGADDYITKPFSMEELLARVSAVLRRTKVSQANEPALYKFGSFTFDYHNQLLKSSLVDDQKLTTKETELLRLLCKNMNQVLEREAALRKIWGSDSYFTARSMDVFITKLRKYLKEDPNIQIVNIHGTGYKLAAQVVEA